MSGSDTRRHTVVAFAISLLLAMSSTTGCIVGNEVIIPDFFGERCERDEEVDESFKTALGTVDLIEVTGSCSDAGTYHFEDLDLLDLDEIEFGGEPDDIKFTVRKPYWLRVSARVDGKKNVWDFVAAKNRNGRVDGVQCKTPVLGAKRPSLEACLGPNLVKKYQWGRWADIARMLDDTTIFDDDARALILEHRDDPVQILRGVAYFYDTSLLEPGSHVTRTAEEQAAVRSLLDEVGCAPMVGASADIWTPYVDMVQRIMGERVDKLLHPCVGRLLDNWADQPANLRPLLDKEGVVEKLDAAITAQPERVDVGVLDLWSARLQRSPRPPKQLVDAMDQRLAASLPESSQAVDERLDSEMPIAAANAERLAAAVNTCCLVDDLALKVRARNEVAPHRDSLDHAFLDVLVRDDISKDERSGLIARIEQSDEVPFGVDVRERLEQVLLHHLESLGAEVLLLIEHAPSKAARDEFVAAFDQRLGKTFPIGSKAYLGRLEQALLPRPSESSRRAIVERARAVKRAGEPIDDAACEVLRAVLMLPNDRGTCEVPEEF